MSLWKNLLYSIKDTAHNVGTWSQKHLNNWYNFFGDIQTAWDTITGKNEEKHATRAEELAKQSEDFNEQFSKEQLAENARQFDVSNKTAQDNIAWQKDIAEKNLAMQQDVFNAQMRENEITRQREDTAYQRQVADLKAAGFSPLMASNGAGAASMSVGSAPQYDVSGVSAAQGSALDLARQYAELRNMIQGQYLTRKQQAQNMRIGAMQALSDLSYRRRENFQNLALQTFNTAVQTKKTIQEMNIAKGTYDWNIKHGFRNQNMWSILLPVISDLANKFNVNTDTIASAMKNGYSEISNTISSIINGKEPDRNALPETTKELTSNLDNNTLKDLGMLLALKPHLNDNQLKTAADTLYPQLDDKRKNFIKSSNDLYDWFKRDGFYDVIALAFGLK